MKIGDHLQTTMLNLEKQADSAKKIAEQLQGEPEKLSFGARRIKSSEGSVGNNVDTKA